MSNEGITKIESLVLEHLRHIRRRLDTVDEEIRQMTFRLQRLEEKAGDLHRDISGLHSDFAAQSARMDEFADRVDRIERRLEIATDTGASIP